MAGTVAEGRTYWGWQRLLAEKLLTERAPDEPFVFFLDDAELSRLWPEVPNPARQLGSAVARQLHWQSGAGLFSDLARVNQDRAPGNLPPTLPVLAVTVLAASRMHRDVAANANAYYVRLAEVLRPDQLGAHLRESTQRLRSGFDTVATFWREFDMWIRSSRRYGWSTILEHPQLTRIGFPLSQAVLRESDRMLLTEFFNALDLGGSGMPERAALASALRIWTSRSRGLSEGFRFALEDPILADLAVGEVDRLMRSWDGLVRQPGGRQRLDMRLVIDFSKREARWTASILPKVTHDTLTTVDGSRFMISTPEWGTQYSITGAPPPARVMHKRIQAHGSSCSATMAVPEVFAASEETDAAGWVAADGIEPRKDYLFVVAERFSSTISEILDEAAEPGWKPIPLRVSNELLPATAMYRNVRLSDSAAFERAMGSLSPGLRSALRPETPPRPRLVGGLRIMPNLGKNHYLQGGEPDLLLPAKTEVRTVTASLDGRIQQPPFLATGFAVPLRSPAASLEVGRHTLLVDGDTLTFDVHESGYATAAALALGWTLTEYAPDPMTTGPFDVTGASVSGSAPEPRLLRRISEWFVIDRHGRLAEVDVPAPPKWAIAQGLPESQYFEFFPSPENVWLVEFRHGAARKPELLRWLEPIAGSMSSRDRHGWDSMTGLASNDRLLGMYIKVLLS